MNVVAGAMAPVVVAGTVAVEVEEKMAVEGETMEIVFCLLIGYRIDRENQQKGCFFLSLSFYIYF